MIHSVSKKLGALSLAMVALSACDNQEAANLTQQKLASLGWNVKVDASISTDTMELLTKDLITLKSRQSEIASQMNQSSLLQTNSGKSIISYLDERFHVLSPELSDSELTKRCTGADQLKYQDFMNDPEEEKKMKDAGGEVGAANIGAAAWLLSVVNEKPLSCQIAGQNIPVDSTRVGIVMFGPGYKEKERVFLGLIGISLPAEYRQSVLVHEARHSDCPKGLTEEDLEVARHSANAKEFDREFKGRQCGHLHKICPEGHAFAGIAACDDVPYGAYYFGAAFSQGATRYLEGTQAGTAGLITDASIMSAVESDSLSRVLVDSDGDADLTSTNEIHK